MGNVYTDGIDGNFLDGGYNTNKPTPYSRTIYIPITLEEGKVMTYYAEQLRDNPGNYNLYARNCGMVAQDILRMGGKNFATGSEYGKNVDEQAAMLKIGLLLGMHNGLGIAQVLLQKVGEDYLNQTIPDGAYYAGWLWTNSIMYLNGWEAGPLEQFADRYKDCGLE